MWVPDRTRLLKIRLHNQGEDPETVWAEDLGIVVLHRDARYVRVGNIPVLHAKPTYGDVIEVLMHADDFPEWDRKGVDLDEIDTRILEDGGRWVAIINYWPSRPGADLQSTYQALHDAAEARDIAVEGVLAEANRGCAYLAVPESADLADLLAWLLSQRASFGFELLHPDADWP